MNVFVKHCILGAILLIMQILMTEFINISPFLLLSVFPVFIVTLPININYTLLMFIAAGYGLTVDIFTEGVVGINAAALTAMAAAFGPIMRLVIPKILLYDVSQITFNEVSLDRLIVINALLCFVYLAVYLLLHTMEHGMFLYNLFRFAVNLIIDVALWVFLEYTLERQIFK